MTRTKTVLAGTLPLAGLLAVAYLLDLHNAASLSLAFVGAVAVLGLLAVGEVWVVVRRPDCLLPFVPFLVALMLLSQASTSARKPFRRFYSDITLGMTKPDVLRVLDRHFPRGGRYPRPLVNRLAGPQHIGFILDPNDGAYNAEIVGIDFKDRRVVRKHYWPD
jgi:hypothetical protein